MTPAQMVVGKTYTVFYRSGPQVRQVRATLEGWAERGTRYEKAILRRPGSQRTSLIPTMFVERVERSKEAAAKVTAGGQAPGEKPGATPERGATMPESSSVKAASAKKSPARKSTAKKATAKKSPAKKPTARIRPVAEKATRSAPTKDTAMAHAREAMALLEKASTADQYRQAANAFFRAYNHSRNVWKALETKVA